MNEAIDLSDIPELGDEFFTNARRIGPLVQKDSIIVDHDIYEWFRATFPEPDCSRRLSQILRVYMERYQARLAAQSAGEGVA
jgi:hypothetical protein